MNKGYYFNTADFVRIHNVTIDNAITGEHVAGWENGKGGYAFDLEENGFYTVHMHVQDYTLMYNFRMIDGTMGGMYNIRIY